MSDYWDARAAEVDDPILPGTVTDEVAVVRLRDRLEKAHLARAVPLTRQMRAIEIGAGAGRVSLWLAERVGEVTLVDASEGQLAIARREAARRGLTNVKTIHASAETFRPEAGAYDLVLFSGLLTCLDDAAVEALVDPIADALTDGGRLVLKEPVTTDGVPREDRRPGYIARFRPRERLAQIFGRRLPLLYQRPTLAHPVPFFLGSTNEAAASVGGGPASRALEALAPLWERLDPTLLELESYVRSHPALAPLLAPVPVLQDLYVFGAPSRAAASDAPALSVVVIAYNEEECLAEVTAELSRALSLAGIAFELVMVDDGSADQTLAIMRRLAAADPRVVVVPLSPNRGIGGALRAGFDRARGGHVTWVPADGQIGPDTVVELYRRRGEAPMLTTVYTDRDDPIYRTVISRTLNTIIRLRTGEVAKSGGNYLFGRSAWERHAPPPDDSMMISTAFRSSLRAAGVPIVEVPIRARARVAGHSKVLNPRTILRTLASTLAMRRG